MSKLGYKLKELLTFTKGEKVGMAVLIAICLTVLFYPQFKSSRPTEDSDEESFELFKQKVDELYASANQPAAANGIEKQVGIYRQSPELMMFDPNTADSLTYLKLGFTPKQVSSILRYRLHGGYFSRVEDFKRLYVVSDEKYEQLKPYISITRKTHQPTSFTLMVELNAADTTELKRLRGIGSYYAKRIVAYRERLGGFVSVEQVMEIDGIDSERFALFSSNAKVDKNLSLLLPISTATEDRLRRHPYIAAAKARQIVRLRKEQPIVSMSVLIAEGVFTTQQAEKVSPYLKFE